MTKEIKIYDEFMQDEVDTCITQEDKENTYPHLVDYFIRLNYSISQELALNRQRDTKVDEWNEYNQYCEDAKAYAKQLLNLV